MKPRADLSATALKAESIVLSRLADNEKLLWCGQEKLDIAGTAAPFLLIPLLMLAYQCWSGNVPTVRGAILFFGAFLFLAWRFCQLKSRLAFAVTNQRLICLSLSKSEPLWWIELQHLAAIEKTGRGDIKFTFSQKPTVVALRGGSHHNLMSRQYLLKIGTSSGRAIESSQLVVLLQEQAQKNQ